MAAIPPCPPAPRRLPFLMSPPMTRNCATTLVGLFALVLLSSSGLVAQTAPSTAKKPAAAKAVAPQQGKPTQRTPGNAAAATKAPAKAAAVAKSQPAKSSAGKIDPLDWTSWRGPEQNGISREKNLIDKWDYEGENVLWRNPEGGGIATPIVMNGKLYTMVRWQPDTKREGEAVVCLDANTGKKLWENHFNVYLSAVPAERVGWASVVGDPTTGRVYALGVCGYFQCLDAETGKTIWSRSLAEEFGLLSTYGGRTASPTLFEDLVIINSVMTGWGQVAVPAQQFLAMKKDTGEIVWMNNTKPRPEDTTYSTPVFTTLAGQSAMVVAGADGAVWAFQPRTGQPIWEFQISRRGINASPVVVGDKVYVGHSNENADNLSTGGFLAIDGSGHGDITEKGELWRTPDNTTGTSSPLVVDGRVYAFDDTARMFIFDVETGKSIGRPVKLVGTILRAAPVYGDGKIYVCTTSAWHVIEPTESGAKIIHKMRLQPEDEVSGACIISHGKVYLPTQAAMYCLGTKDSQPEADERPSQPIESPAGKDDKPAYVQVLPAELLLRPGDKQKFTARTFNERGQLLEETKAEFKLNGPGKIDDAGEFTAVTDSGNAVGENYAPHTATILTAKVGDLTGEARIRVVPPLPYKFDFNDGQVPITWIGARYRHVPRVVDGEKVIAKITTIPKGAKSQSWMGQTDYHDYTVQADMCGALSGDKLPDMGLIAQRYTLDLMGASQQLQIRSWTPQLQTRFSESKPVKWEADKWYTLKFRAAVEDGKAVLRGKVWPRDEKEPADWMIEAVDEEPNVVGSPGLYGNANDSEIFIDNVIVTPNRADAPKTAKR